MNNNGQDLVTIAVGLRNLSRPPASLAAMKDEFALDEIVKKVAKAPPPRQDEKPKVKKR